MKNLKSFVDADPNSSSITQHCDLNYYTNLLLNENSQFDADELQIDWSPLAYGINELVFETPPSQPPSSRNQVNIIENDSSRLTSFANPSCALERSVEMPQHVPTRNMVFDQNQCVAMTPSSPPRNRTTNIENGLIYPTSSVIPCLDPNPTLGRQAEMPRFDDPTVNMVIENPWNNAMQPSSSSLPCNQTMNLGDNLNPTPFFYPVLDPNQETVKSVEMHEFNPIEFENHRIATSSFLSPHNQTSNIENGLVNPSSFLPPHNQTTNIDQNGLVNPTSFVIPCLDPNPTLGRQVEMSRFDDPTENMVMENTWIHARQPSSSSLPCNQTMNLENNFNSTPLFNPLLDPYPDLMRPVEMHQFNPIENMVFENQLIATSPSFLPSRPSGHEYKTNADIICENYLEAYRVDPSSIRTAVDRSCAAAGNNVLNFNHNNGFLFSSGSEMHDFPATATVDSTSTEFPPPCNKVEAATHGGARPSTFKRNWSDEEHKLLLVGMEIYGRGDWTNIAKKVVMTKSNTQVSSHAQKYFLHLTLLDKTTKKKKRHSIHDITSVDPELLSSVRARLGLPQSVNHRTI